MSQTKLLWELENHNKLLDKYKKKLETLKNNPEIQRIKLRHKQLEERLFNQKEINIRIQKRLKEKENTLKNHTFTMDELDKKLYSNQMTDFKQLDYLILEKEKFKSSVNDLEVEIIDILDEIQIIEKETSQLEDELENLNNKIVEYEKMKLEAIEKITFMIKDEESIIKDFNHVIEPKIMEKYKLLKGSKNSGVVQVINGVCSGCNMVIPAYIMDKVNAKSDLVTCENCGRILFIYSETSLN